MTDEEVITHLTAVKGIGRWTAEMKLMFTLHRPDILPLDDVGIQNAMIRFLWSEKGQTAKDQYAKDSGKLASLPHSCLLVFVEIP